MRNLVRACSVIAFVAFLLGAALGLLAARRGWKALRRWYRNRYRREAAARLLRLPTR